MNVPLGSKQSWNLCSVLGTQIIWIFWHNAATLRSPISSITSSTCNTGRNPHTLSLSNIQFAFIFWSFFNTKHSGKRSSIRRYVYFLWCFSSIGKRKSLLDMVPNKYVPLNKVKAMKSSPLLRPFCVSEFWGFSLLNI